tara:strand:- start:1116 stop:1880 length:765 start_codon:yes stop_codon:yes gene_type:complete
MSTWKKVITDGAALTNIGTPASGDKVLIQDITDGEVIKYVAFSALGGSSTNTNLAIANLTADNNRTLDMDGNSLIFDLNGGDFTVEDTTSGFQHILIGQDLLELGDSLSRVVVEGDFLAEKGVEQDEASLTAAGAFGAGADITFLGSSQTSANAGRIYYYSGAAWVAFTSATEAPQKALLGIAIGSTMAKGFILKGFIRPNAVASSTAGAPVFGATNASITSTAPTAGYQRVMGHAISTSVIYFNPSAEYLELT